MQTVTQNIEAEVVFIALDDADDVVTGLAYTDVTVEYKKYDSDVFVPKTLVSADWEEIGDGVYTILFSEDELDVAGAFVFKVEGDDIATHIEIISVISDGSSEDIDVEVCTVSGYVYDVTGEPVEGAAVRVRVLGFPTTVDDLAVLVDTSSAVYTDDNGYFEMSLVREAYVDISISAANYRRQLTVPDSATASLFSIE